MIAMEHLVMKTGRKKTDDFSFQIRAEPSESQYNDKKWREPLNYSELIILCVLINLMKLLY